MFEIKLYYRGKHIDSVNYSGSLLSTMKKALSYLRQNQCTCTSVYKDGEWIKEFML